MKTQRKNGSAQDEESGRLCWAVSLTKSRTSTVATQRSTLTDKHSLPYEILKLNAERRH